MEVEGGSGEARYDGFAYVLCGVLIFFFFQAEDGIRDYDVTGVQTCALPICQSEIWGWVRLTERLLPLQQLNHRLAHRFSDVLVGFRIPAVVSA